MKNLLDVQDPGGPRDAGGTEEAETLVAIFGFGFCVMDFSGV